MRLPTSTHLQAGLDRRAIHVKHCSHTVGKHSLFRGGVAQIISDAFCLFHAEASARTCSPTERESSMGEDLDDLRRRMLDRRRQHLRDRKAGSLALVATALGASFVSVFLWQEMSPPELGKDHAAFHASMD